jgi:hypothetical protein
MSFFQYLLGVYGKILGVARGRALRFNLLQEAGKRISAAIPNAALIF